MSTNILGIRNNNVIVPYSAATKRTKEIRVTDPTHIVLTGTNITAGTTSIKGAYIRAYSDSTGVWRLAFNIAVDATSTGVRTDATITFASTYAVVFRNLTNFYQDVSGFCGSSGNPANGHANPGASTITLLHPSFGEGGYLLSGDVVLESKPSWADANMEGVTAVDVLIPTATDTVPGLLSYYKEFSGATAACTGAFTTGASWSGVHIGKQVTIRLNPVNGAANNTQTQFVYGSTIPAAHRPGNHIAIPCQVKNNGIYVTGTAYVDYTDGRIVIYAGINFTDRYDGTCGLDYDFQFSYCLV